MADEPVTIPSNKETPTMTNHLPIGTRVRVHKNLLRQRQGLSEQWTISTKIKGKGWRVHHHAETVTLTDAQPVCSASGAARIRRRGEREVVARIEGNYHEQLPEIDGSVDSVRVHYNPFKNDNFLKATVDGDVVFTYAHIAHFPSCTAYFLAV